MRSVYAWCRIWLRDLRTSAFLNVRDWRVHFPLTGRARMVSEMMELMRTIEAIEKFTAEMRANPHKGFTGDWSIFSREEFSAGSCQRGRRAVGQHLLILSDLPGLAGRLEIPRLIARSMES